jgi:hypothetical protein
MKIILPSQINPPRLRKDGSASLVFDTRELMSEEIFTIMQMRHSEGWLCFAPNENEIDIPEEHAEIDEKSASERLRNVLFVLYKQETDAGRYVGLFETFRKERMEQIISTVKKKILN